MLETPGLDGAFAEDIVLVVQLLVKLSKVGK